MRSSAPRRPPRCRSAGEPGKENASSSPSAASRSSAATAGIAEPEHPRALVEGLARGVVERRPRTAKPSCSWTRASSVCPPLAMRHRNGGSNGGSGRRRRKFAATWPCRWSTAANGRRARRGERLGVRKADEQRADQPGAACRRDQVDVVEAGAGFAQGVRRSRDRSPGGAGARRSLARRRRIGRGRAARRSRSRGSCRRASTTAAHVSSQLVSIARTVISAAGSGRPRACRASVPGVRHMTRASSPLSR